MRSKCLATVFHIGLLDACQDHFWQKLADPPPPPPPPPSSAICCLTVHNSHGQLSILFQKRIQVGFTILQGLPLVEKVLSQ